VSAPPTARTRLVALLGDPVAHSLSPRFQNAAFAAAQVDGVYLALRCDAATLPSLLRGIAAAGGAGNVTVPHKQRAAQVVTHRTAAVQRTGACNTFWHAQDALWGDNTDVWGASRALEELLGAPPRGARVLLLGGGGAAGAALCALVDAGSTEVVLLNRSAARARQLWERFADVRTRIGVAEGVEHLRNERFDVVINATSLGLRPEDPLPLHPESGVRFAAALDLVYHEDRTPWVRSLIGSGIPAADGLGMLLYQGAAAFERWWDQPAPLEVMRAALRPPTRDATATTPAAAG
jgi:shikimate dehydrogenase